MLGASMSPEQPGLSPTAFPDRQDIFAGNGLMSQRMRAFDWGSTLLGEPEGWPQSLKTIVRTMLTSRFAMWMGWGPDTVRLPTTRAGSRVCSAW